MPCHETASNIPRASNTLVPPCFPLWSSSGRLSQDCLPLWCHGCLSVLSWFQTFIFHCHFHSGAEPGAAWCQRRMRTHQHLLEFGSHLIKKLMKGHVPNCFRKQREKGDEYVRREGEEFEGDECWYIFFLTWWLLLFVWLLNAELSCITEHKKLSYCTVLYF